MNTFAENLKKFRQDRNMSQQQLSDLLFVDRTTIANWETGRRTPDAMMIIRISKVFEVDPTELFAQWQNPAEEGECPCVVILDDEQITLQGAQLVLKDTFPNAEIKGFLKPSDALAFARERKIDILFLDIEMGTYSGLDLCGEFLAINNNTNIIYLTAFMDYSLNAWDTGACGFLLKPLSPDAARKQLSHLKHPVRGLF